MGIMAFGLNLLATDQTPFDGDDFCTLEGPRFEALRAKAPADELGKFCADERSLIDIGIAFNGEPLHSLMFSMVVSGPDASNNYAHVYQERLGNYLSKTKADLAESGHCLKAADLGQKLEELFFVMGSWAITVNDSLQLTQDMEALEKKITENDSSTC